MTLKILFLIDELCVRGGTERHLLDLVRGVVALGVSVHVVSLRDGAFAEKVRCLPNVRYACLGIVRLHDLRGLRALVGLANLIRRERFDIVQTFHAASDLLGPLAARLSARKLFVVSSRRDLGYTKNRRHIRAQRLLNRWVDGMLANSLAVRDAIVAAEGYPMERITVIYNGIDTSLYERIGSEAKEESRQAFGLPRKHLVVGALGNIRPVKGIDDLVQAAIEVLRSRRDVCFAVAGEGNTGLQVKALAMAGVSDQFRFLGKLGEEEVRQYLALLDIYVHPSRSEGFSNAILEAMALGLPIVATAVGGTTEVIRDGENGMLVPAFTPRTIADAIERYIEHPELRLAHAEHARRDVRTGFALSSMLNGYMDFYARSLLAR